MQETGTSVDIPLITLVYSLSPLRDPTDAMRAQTWGSAARRGRFILKHTGLQSVHIYTYYCIDKIRELSVTQRHNNPGCHQIIISFVI